MPDVDVTVEPTRISDKPGHDTARVTAHFNAGAIRAVRIELEGRPIYRRGVVCGLDRCGPTAVPITMAAGSELEHDITYAATQPHADGDVPGRVRALVEEDRWA